MRYDFVGIDSMSLGVVALLNEHRMRSGVIVQAGDVPETERQVYCRFAVRRIKRASLRGVLVGAQIHVESFFDARYCADEPQVHGITGAAGNLKAAGFRERHQRVPFFLAGSESCRELLRREKA